MKAGLALLLAAAGEIVLLTVDGQIGLAVGLQGIAAGILLLAELAFGRASGGVALVWIMAGIAGVALVAGWWTITAPRWAIGLGGGLGVLLVGLLAAVAPFHRADKEINDLMRRLQQRPPGW